MAKTGPFRSTSSWADAANDGSGRRIAAENSKAAGRLRAFENPIGSFCFFAQLFDRKKSFTPRGRTDYDSDELID